MTPRACLLLGSFGLAVLGAAHYWGSRLPSQRESYVAATSGSFRERAADAGGPPGGHRHWDSDAAAGPGTVSLGPFPAPDRLRFEMRGGRGTAAVYLELVGIGARLPIEPGPGGEGWRDVDFGLPYGWRGRLVTLNARAGAGGAPGGLAISEPFGHGSGGSRGYGLLETLAAWLANGLLYGALFAVFARALARREDVSPGWIPLVACALVALVGYAAFWSYFASATLGRAFSCCVLAAAWLAVGASGERFGRRDAEWIMAGCAAALVGLLYLGILHLFPVDRDFYDLASNRFVAGMPGDGRLPFDFADLLYHGQRPRELGAGWLSSDRPPLEEGWQLIAWPVTQAMGLSDQSASGTASVWFQLSWVPALYGLLRSLRMAAPRALAWTMAASLNGFFLMHTVFTWPKLSAAAFACGAFGIWILGGGRNTATGRSLGAALAGLGLLSHGGVAFTLIPLLPWVLLRCLKGELRRWAAAAAVFALVMAPWVSYQKLFAPPGDRLLKLHLAGQDAMDGRPALRAIADAYRALSWRQLLEMRASNFEYQAGGGWLRMAGWSPGSAGERRMDEYYHMFRALGWWGLALPLVVVSALGPSRRAALSESSGRQAALAAWAVSSAALWCALLFTRAEIAHGSLAVMIAMFALGARWFEAAGGWCLPCLAALQALSLATTWVPGNAVVGGEPSWPAAVLAAAAACGAAWLAVRVREYAWEARAPERGGAA